jgi:hypothetical protein
VRDGDINGALGTWPSNTPPHKESPTDRLGLAGHECIKPVAAYGLSSRDLWGPSRGLCGPPHVERALSIGTRRHPHFDSPQFRQVMQLSIITTAAVLHLLHS